MSINYICRYCHQLLGRIEDDRITEWELGFHQLTPSERQDIITHDMKGDTHVRVVCESCQQMLDEHPELSLLPHPFQ